MKKTAILKIKVEVCDRNRNFGEIIESIYEVIKEREGVEGFEIMEEFLKMKIETPENFDDDMTQVAPKMKTLKEKRQELLNKNMRYVDRTCKGLVLEIVGEQDKEFIKEILDEIFKNAVIVKEIDLNRKLIYVDLVEEIIKQNSGYEE